MLLKSKILWLIALGIFMSMNLYSILLVNHGLWGAMLVSGGSMIGIVICVFVLVDLAE